jgi:hypothetical protein
VPDTEPEEEVLGYLDEWTSHITLQICL